MRVFLDTNVLVSAHATRGLCRDVLRLILAEHTLLSGEAVLGEVERVLTTKFRLPREVVEEVVAFLREHHVEPRPESVGDLRVRDPDDAWVLASALAAGADVLVTGDPDLLELAGAISGLRITNPRGFWELHRLP